MEWPATPYNRGFIAQTITAYGGQAMKNDITLWVGMDVHKDTIALHWFRGDRDQHGEEVQITNDEKSIRRVMRRLKKEGDIRACYEAGPCGYAVRRLLSSMGI